MQSLFDKYNNYSKGIILLSIRTMSPNDVNLLKKGYGENYLGKGHLYHSEQFSFDMANTRLQKRLKEVDELVKQGKTEEQILKIYSKQKLQGSIASYFSYGSKTDNAVVHAKAKAIAKSNTASEKTVLSRTKINKPLEEYFPISLRKDIMMYIKREIIDEERDLLNYFFIGKNYEICRQYADDLEKIEQLTEFIKKVIDLISKRKSTKVAIKNTTSSKKQVKVKNQENERINGITAEEVEGKTFIPVKGKVETSKPSTNANKKSVVKSESPTTKHTKGTKKGGKRPSGYLDSLSEEKKELAIIIIQEFKNTYPHYYDAITKKYSGQYYEIVSDVELSNEEKNCLANAKAKICKMLMQKDKQMEKTSLPKEPIDKIKLDKPLEQYFSVKIRKEAMKYIKKNISNEEKNLLRYFYDGRNYEICKEFINDQKKIIELNILINRINNYVMKMIFMEKESKNNNSLLETSISKKIGRPAKGFLELCGLTEEADKKIAVEIIEEFKELYPQYYYVITKYYSGEYYDKTDNSKIEKKDDSIKNRAKNKLIEMFNIRKNGNHLNETRGRKKSGYLSSYAEKDIQRALEIIENFRITNPKYYDVITKQYSGEYYEIVNDIKLTEKEEMYINYSRIKLKKLLLSSNENVNYINDILQFVPINISTDLMFNCIINKKINILEIMSGEEVLESYIENLHCFSSDDAIKIIRIISTFVPSKISKIIHCSYFENKLQSLTLKEQEYVYLTLLSYSKPLLTNDKISEILKIDSEYLKEYQIMTSQDDVNKLNILLNKDK